ncbi:MAG: helix-turn-helix domain-containing protein [Mycobacterium sp.]|nr:helix-turn-helix domain-containing protein [Mycobacterium sp.]
MYRLVHTDQSDRKTCRDVPFENVGVRRDKAEAALIQWRINNEKRDRLVRNAKRAGININQIHALTGIGRSTIYRILATPAPARPRRNKPTD